MSPGLHQAGSPKDVSNTLPPTPPMPITPLPQVAETQTSSFLQVSLEVSKASCLSQVACLCPSDSPTCLDARRVHHPGHSALASCPPPTGPAPPPSPTPRATTAVRLLPAPQSQPCPFLHLSRGPSCCLWAGGDSHLPLSLPLWWGSPANFLWVKAISLVPEAKRAR